MKTHLKRYVCNICVENIKSYMNTSEKHLFIICLNADSQCLGSYRYIVYVLPNILLCGVKDIPL